MAACIAFIRGFFGFIFSWGANVLVVSLMVAAAAALDGIRYGLNPTTTLLTVFTLEQLVFLSLALRVGIIEFKFARKKTRA